MNMITVFISLFTIAFVSIAEAQRGWNGRWKESRTDQGIVYREYSIHHDGKMRWYILYEPKGLKPGAQAVVLLHGGTQSMRKMFDRQSASGIAWRTLADQEGFLLIVPNGTNAQTGDTDGDSQNWNDIRLKGSPRHSRADDVGFITTLVNKLAHQFELDRNRMFVTGSSNGGMMTYRLLIEQPDLFAAGAAFVANFPGGALDTLREPAQPTPLMIMNGTEDPLVPFDGGKVGRNMLPVHSAAETVAWWVKVNNANPSPASDMLLPDVDTRDECRVRLTRYKREGSTSAPVYFYSVIGGGHVMPSQNFHMRENLITNRLIGRQCHDVEGTVVAWQFFQRYSDF